MTEQEVVKLVQNVNDVNRRLALAHREIRRLRDEFASIAHAIREQNGNPEVALSICEQAVIQSRRRYIDAEDDE